MLAFARAMGEFGATLMVPAVSRARTQTLSIAVYEAVQAGKDDMANFLVVVTSVVCITVLVASGGCSEPAMPEPALRLDIRRQLRSRGRVFDLKVAFRDARPHRGGVRCVGLGQEPDTAMRGRAYAPGRGAH